jgi:hypothetical protein
MPRVVNMAEGSPGAVQNGLSDLMYPCGKGIHVSRREGKAFKQVWARHLVDTVGMWLKCNSTPPFR